MQRLAGGDGWCVAEQRRDGSQAAGGRQRRGQQSDAQELQRGVQSLADQDLGQGEQSRQGQGGLSDFRGPLQHHEEHEGRSAQRVEEPAVAEARRQGPARRLHARLRHLWLRCGRAAVEAPQRAARRAVRVARRGAGPGAPDAAAHAEAAGESAELGEGGRRSLARGGGTIRQPRVCGRVAAAAGAGGAGAGSLARGGLAAESEGC
mmetsp:Transcript_30831/g.88625  ORF Transcript_30831/g.88625 Transcript_30831/m.88625 type:complete len:206 (-) Transcript_30831:840-1457(-)